MNSRTPTTANELFKLMLAIFPDAQIEEDNDGQIIVYTGLALNNFYEEEERLIPFSEVADA